MRIVGNIQNHNRPARQHLEATRDINLKQAIAYVLDRNRQPFAQTIENSDTGGRIGQLVGTAQQRIGQRTSISERSPVSPFTQAGYATEITIYAQQPDPELDRMRCQTGRRISIGAYRMPASTKNAGLLIPNGLATVTEIVHVVKIDTCNQGTVRIKRVDRIQPSAHTDFEYRNVNLRRVECQHRSQGAEFEIGERRIRACLVYAFKRTTKRCVVNLDPVNANTFVIPQQMRRHITAYAIARAPKYRLEHGTTRSLAVGAADGNDRKPGRQIQRPLDAHHTLKPHCDGLGVQPLKVSQPLDQVFRSAVHDD
jgi:hypothetical protein